MHSHKGSRQPSWCYKRIQYSAFSQSACLNATTSGMAAKAHTKVQYIHWAHLLHHSILGFNRHCRKGQTCLRCRPYVLWSKVQTVKVDDVHVIQQTATHEHACYQALKHLEGFCFIGISATLEQA